MLKFDNDIANSMEGLLKTASTKPIDLTPAVESLHAALEILDDIKLYSTSDRISNFLTKFANRDNLVETNIKITSIEDYSDMDLVFANYKELSNRFVKLAQEISEWNDNDADEDYDPFDMDIEEELL